MITDWIRVERVKISKAEMLYPRGLDWELKPGINAVIGGTGLGKTTFVKALQYGIFDKMIGSAGERIDSDFFKGRLTSRSAEKIKDEPPAVEVEFSAGDSSFLVRRNLLNGVLLAALCDGIPLKATQYRDTLAEKVGLERDFASLTRLQSHLLFFGENRFLLAWENLLQNEMLNLMLSDHTTYVLLNQLWKETESADSEARNLSTQASRLEKDLEIFGSSNNVRELERRRQLNEFVYKREAIEARIAHLGEEVRKEEQHLAIQDEELTRAQLAFQQDVEVLEAEISADLDDDLLNAAMAATPTIASVRYSLESFFRTPYERPCPCCGRPGLSPTLEDFAKEAAAAAQSGNCIVCSKEIDFGSARATKTQPIQSSSVADASVATLKDILFKREQSKSRLDGFRRELAEAHKALAKAREEELAYLQQNPAPAVQPLQVAVEELRRRQKDAQQRRDRKLKRLRRELETTNAAFRRIQSDIAEAFRKYATLYLDEECDVEFLVEDRLPGKRGPQVKAPHAAFYPIVAGKTRSSPQALSDAQRSFIDLAFRMAVVDVWRQLTNKTVTMIVETPEGAVDLAYMERVASMLRTFSNQGHTLIITTNLNNEVFLPELLASSRKSERMKRLLNLIDLGRPRRVQERHRAQFDSILRAVADHPIAK